MLNFSISSNLTFELLQTNSQSSRRLNLSGGGVCGTNDINFSASFLSFRVFTPFIATLPLFGTNSPKMIRMSELLPAPFCPSIAIFSPAFTFRLTLSSIFCEPKIFVTSFISIKKFPYMSFLKPLSNLSASWWQTSIHLPQSVQSAPAILKSFLLSSVFAPFFVIKSTCGTRQTSVQTKQ